MNASPSPATIWEQHARRTSRRLNLAWWLQSFAPCSAGLGLAIMSVALWLRSQGTPFAAGPTTAFVAGLYLLAGLGCWATARKRFAHSKQGLVLLESRLKLDNALSAAGHGVTAWPAAPTAVDDGFRFRAPWLMAPVLLTFTCLSLAFLLPLSPSQSAAKLPPPMALARAEEILNALQQQEIAGPAAIEQARLQLEALKNQPQEDYYTHHSLEAADALETSLSQAAGSLGGNLQNAAHAAESLEKYDSSLSPAARSQLESDLNAALEGLKNSSLGNSEALQKQLSQLDPAKLKQIDPEQLKKMLANLKAKSAACKKCQGGGQGTGGSEADQALADLLNGNKKGNSSGQGEGQDGEDGDGMGRGGVNRGPGTGPLTFEKNASDLATERLEQLESNDLSRTLPGDHLGTSNIEHQLDKTATGPTAGGAIKSDAGGGDAVWRGSLMPSEQKVLRRYFK